MAERVITADPHVRHVHIKDGDGMYHGYRIEVYVHSDSVSQGKGMAAVRVRCQTDEGAKSGPFVRFCKRLAMMAYAAGEADLAKIRLVWPEMDAELALLQEKPKTFAERRQEAEAKGEAVGMSQASIGEQVVVDQILVLCENGQVSVCDGGGVPLAVVRAPAAE
jgi:hypothetical protein